MRKAMVRCNISKNQVIFCGHVSHKYYNSVGKHKRVQCFVSWCLNDSMARLLVVDGPSSSKISAGFANKWGQPWKTYHSWAILRVGGFYWLVYYYYNHAMAIKGKKLVV